MLPALRTWEENHVPWSTCFIDHYVDIWAFDGGIDEINNWSSKNLKGKYELTVGVGYFEFEEDKVMFVLRWL